MAIVGVFSALALPDFFTFQERVRLRMVDNVIKDLNRREDLIWMTDASTTEGFDDALIFALVHPENLGAKFTWATGPNQTGMSTIQFGPTRVDVHRTPSRKEAAGVWQRKASDPKRAFNEITGSMIARVQQFFDQTGRYPRSWGDYAFTDVGLDPDDWRIPVDGVYYATGGNRIKITPAEGYEIHVAGADGEERIMKPSYNWSLWYSMTEGKWYYHSIKDENEIDISTLEIVKHAP